MYTKKNVECLFPGDNAEEKIAAYKALPVSEHYKINRDFFQVTRFAPDPSTKKLVPTAAYKPTCVPKEL